MIDGRPFQLGPERQVTIKELSVMNKGQDGRITFIFDYVYPTASEAVLID